MNQKPRIHLIAIGGSIMHSLAINLHLRGYSVTGSDDEIFEPSRSNLLRYGILPPDPGWFPEKITQHPDIVILGMHARKDNPELQEALRMGIPVFSFPEYFYLQTRNAKRIVIAGSHGKTTTTAMVMHALRMAGISFSYLIGSRVPGFEHQVWIEPEADLAVMEGDEYLSSPLDDRPKFLHYHPHIALITGIAWDHMNVFPRFEDYVNAFARLIQNIEPGGTLIYCDQDENLRQLASSLRPELKKILYNTLPYQLVQGKTIIETNSRSFETELFGRHMMQNMNGAMLAAQEAGLSSIQFLTSMQTFRGADKRLQKIYDSKDFTAFLDFAHAPSKIKASVAAVKEYNPRRKLIACLELHTYSSLNKTFLPWYKGTLDAADFPVVFYSPSAVQHKKMPDLAPGEVYDAFQCKTLQVFTKTKNLEDYLLSLADKGFTLLLMSSGNWGGMTPDKLINMIINKLSL
ncbi:MAG: UDP-N-acetylmuramate--L-alanine ligase [Bacteroidales bacterium]